MEAQETPVAPRGWVPVERRWLGLDKSTILPTIAILAIVIILSSVFPAIDQAVSFNREAKAGDVITLGAGVTFVPAAGWGIQKGLLTTDKSINNLSDSASESAVVVNGGVVFTVVRGPFTGTPSQLITVINRTSSQLKNNQGLHATSSPHDITTDQGQAGVVESYTGSESSGVLAAFVFGHQGVEVTAVGPRGVVRDQLQDVAAMIASIRYEPKGNA